MQSAEFQKLTSLWHPAHHVESSTLTRYFPGSNSDETGVESSSRPRLHDDDQTITNVVHLSYLGATPKQTNRGAACFKPSNPKSKFTQLEASGTEALIATVKLKLHDPSVCQNSRIAPAVPGRNYCVGRSCENQTLACSHSVLHFAQPNQLAR